MRKRTESTKIETENIDCPRQRKKKLVKEKYESVEYTLRKFRKFFLQVVAFQLGYLISAVFLRVYS